MIKPPHSHRHSAEKWARPAVTPYRLLLFNFLPFAPSRLRVRKKVIGQPSSVIGKMKKLSIVLGCAECVAFKPPISLSGLSFPAFS